MMTDEKLKKQAKNNSKDNFKYAFKDAFDEKAYTRMDQNQKIFIKMMNNEDFRKDIISYLMNKVYNSFQQRAN